MICDNDMRIGLNEQSRLDNNAEDADIVKSSKFKVAEWDQFENDLYLYLTSSKITRTVTLVYVIRKDVDPTEIFPPDDEIIYHAPLPSKVILSIVTIKDLFELFAS